MCRSAILVFQNFPSYVLKSDSERVVEKLSQSYDISFENLGVISESEDKKESKETKKTVAKKTTAKKPNKGWWILFDKKTDQIYSSMAKS